MEKSYKIPLILLQDTFHTNFSRGLDSQEAHARLTQHGPNKLKQRATHSLFVVFLTQFQNPLLYILLLSATIIFFLGERRDAFIISGVLFFNAIIGTIQEGRARSILSRIAQLIHKRCVVLRDGKRQSISIEQLVVGDIISLQEGDQVPADARIIQASYLYANESLLTGESAPVEKNTADITKDTVLFDQHNMLFKGTFITSGSGQAVVTATGSNTEIGSLQKTIEEHETDMPLKRELDAVSKRVLYFIIGICLLLFLIGFAWGKSINELLVMLTALFICVIPEGLPIVFTLVLVSGAFRMARQNVLVKRLQATEGLGRVDVIILDKTGTLTRNEMMVSVVVTDKQHYIVTGSGFGTNGTIMHNNQSLQTAEPTVAQHIGLACTVLSNTVVYTDPTSKRTIIEGDPTEAALQTLGQKINITDISEQYTKAHEMPFESTLRMHVVFLHTHDKLRIYVAGAPEIILKHSHASNAQQSSLHLLVEQGLRVIALAWAEFDWQEPHDWRQFFDEHVLNNLQFLVLLGMQDAIRSEVRDMVLAARRSGLRVIMATGDHRSTALYVGEKTGLYQPGDEILDGSQLCQLSDEELLAKLDRICIYARVTPDDKLRIIKAWHHKQAIVAMTGDGINDVPAIVAADLGIAMGTSGTDIAQDAADLILLDDSFSTIIYAIEEGRHIFYTLRRVVLYFFATNLGEVFVVFFALIFNLPLPILAAQILWLNLITDGFLDMALAMETREPGLLSQRWLRYAQKRGLIDLTMLLKIVYVALPMGIGSLLLFYHTYTTDLALARTVTMVCMAMFQWFNAWNCRSEKLSLFQLGFFANRWLILATIGVLILQILVIYVPTLQLIFKTVPLSLHHWIEIFLISSTIIIFEEVRKLIVRTWYPTASH